MQGNLSSATGFTYNTQTIESGLKSGRQKITDEQYERMFTSMKKNSNKGK